MKKLVFLFIILISFSSYQKANASQPLDIITLADSKIRKSVYLGLFLSGSFLVTKKLVAKMLDYKYVKDISNIHNYVQARQQNEQRLLREGIGTDLMPKEIFELIESYNKRPMDTTIRHLDVIGNNIHREKFNDIFSFYRTLTAKKYFKRFLCLLCIFNMNKFFQFVKPDASWDEKLIYFPILSIMLSFLSIFEPRNAIELDNLL